MSDGKKDKCPNYLVIQNKYGEEAMTLIFYSKDGRFYQKTDDDKWIDITILGESAEKQ